MFLYVIYDLQHGKLKLNHKLRKTFLSLRRESNFLISVETLFTNLNISKYTIN